MTLEWLRNPIVHGALIGLATAAKIDYDAFTSWQSPTEAWNYKWSIALWRWFKGSVIGGASGVGLNLLS